jgi:hypothetical protein
MLTRLRCRCLSPSCGTYNGIKIGAAILSVTVGYKGVVCLKLGCLQIEKVLGRRDIIDRRYT